MSKIAIFIPSRMGSTRLPNKPLAMIGDKPMILHVVEKAKIADIGPVYVACAEEEIADVVRNAGCEAILTDPAHNSGSDRIWEALNKIDPEGNIEIIINLQGDMPMIDPEIIKMAAEIMSNSDADIGSFAAPIKSEEELNNPSVVKIALSLNSDAKTDQKPANALYFSRLPVPYGAKSFWHHIGIYAYRRSSLKKFVSFQCSYLENCEKLEQLRALENGMKIDIAIVDAVPMGIDTKEDLEKARAMVEGCYV